VDLRCFLVARNPEPESTLPYLVRLPLGGGLVLKAGDDWPRTTKVYCHRAEAWPDPAEVLQEVPIRSCIRRGAAVDLVLERGRHNRSQFVFTRLKGGREGIFWQTPTTNRASRPGIRLPGRRASRLAALTVLVDTRERYPYRFSHQKAEARRQALPVGDYGVDYEGRLVGLVERKSLQDLAKGLTDGSLAFQMADLATYPRAAVAVEAPYSAVFKHEHVTGGWLAELVAGHQVRYPGVPIVFCGTRPLTEEWTFRFLGAALAFAVDGGAVGEAAPARSPEPEATGATPRRTGRRRPPDA
jgi:hypothetical protein